MKHPLVYVFALGALSACAGHRAAVAPAPARAAAPAPLGAAARAPLPELHVSALLAPGAELKPSAQALALTGTRVRLVGYIAELEEPIAGALYLTSVPVRCDEAGGGTADLPPDAVLVSGVALAGKEPARVAGPVEASGVFSVGNRADASGHVSNFQLVLDDGLARSAEPRTHPLQARR